MSQAPIPSEADAPEHQLCVRCVAPNDPGSHFCVQCGAPLSPYASTGPFESVFAEGAVYREAAQHPTKLIVVLGMWLIFGTMFCVGVFIALIAFDLPGRALGALFSVGSLIMLWRTTRSYIARPRPPRLDA